MSCDYSAKYHGRASRDALRVWSGWTSNVIHGPRYEPDYGPCYESGRRAAQRARPRAAPHASAIAPLDLRTNGRTTPMHINGHR